MSVLFHPACQAFVTHCGMSSTHEAAASGKPVVAIPFGGDQFINAQHAVDQGRGVQVGQGGEWQGTVGRTRGTWWGMVDQSDCRWDMVDQSRGLQVGHLGHGGSE